MTSLDELLNARPTKEVWQEVCLRLAEMDEENLAAVASRVLSWPAQQRPMPDDWWVQWTAGDLRPYHSLAGVRHLGTLDHVAKGRAASEREVSEADEEDDEEGWASFGYGATAVAAPSGLSWLALGAEAEWHHNGGDIVGWNTLEEHPLTWFLSGADYHDAPYDMQVDPDGRTVMTSVEGRVRAWAAQTGDQRWALPVRPGPDDEEDEDDDYETDDYGMDGVVRIGFSGDGRRVAIGTTVPDNVTVVETESGRVVLSVPSEQKAFGPVALDTNGRLLAHAAPEGTVVVRDVDAGVVVATARTGLTHVHALAMAPEGTALFAVGHIAEDATPVAQLLSLDASSDGPCLTPGEPVRPTDLPRGFDPNPWMDERWTRAVWTGNGPYAFVATDNGSILFDATACTRWAHPTSQIASFTPDGRAMVTVGDSIDAWFLAGLP
jgi:hypothetical protein